MIQKTQAIDNIAANVSFAMQVENMTIRSLASEVGSPSATIFTIATGRNEARVSIIANIAERFGVTVDDLLKPPSEFRKLFSRHAVAS